MADLLLEIFSEEIPARMQKDAISHLQNVLVTALTGEKAIPIKNVKTFVTPRRLAISMEGLPSVQSDINTELKGPKVGAPEQAIQGFLKKSGMTLNQLQQVDGVYVAKIHQKGKPTAEILKPLIEDILKSFPWPKSMRWGNHEITWVRPLHSILCIFDGKVVPVEFGPVKAGNVTYGHRFLAPKAITIKKAGDYEKALEKVYVWPDREGRKAVILQRAQDAAKKLGLELKNDIGLLEEVIGLVEWPVVLVGTIDAKYMDLPKEVLVSEMRAHQKYFALTKKDGSLADKFLITANMEGADKAIIAGNERVLRARLADGRFFWDQDRKKSLEEMTKGLASVTYHAKLGSVADKVERVKKLAVELADAVKADKKSVERAAALCKADLVSGMVGEFPELQGVMGRYYALHHKESADVADAIRDHYLPLGPDSPVPTKPVSICVALADKLDTLISMFAIGEKPTGSKDPFALRRAALGIIRIILENNIRLPLKKFMKDDLLEFFHDRLVVQLKDQNIRHDVIKAVVANGDDDLVRIVARAKAVQDFLASDDGTNLLAGYKRAANILAIEEKKDNKKYSFATLDISQLKLPEERALAFFSDGKKSDELESYIDNEKFTELMKWLSTLRTPFDNFFDKVMVNEPDKRINRLSLLASIRDLMNRVANFSKIEGDSKEQKKAA